MQSKRAKTSGVPDLYFDINGISFTPGSTVSVPIKLGNAANPASNFYGVASHVSVGGITLVSAPVITYPSSWVGNASNTISFSKVLNTGMLAWAYSRNDHQNVSGNGTIAMLNFTVPSNVTVGTPITLSFNNSSMIVDNNLVSFTGYNEVDGTALVTTTVGNISSQINYVVVAPNPSGSSANLLMMVAEASTLQITITDVVGKVVSQQLVNVGAGEHALELPAASLGQGLYIIKIGSNGKEAKTVKWMRE